MAQMMHTQGKFRLANLYRLDTRVLELPYKVTNPSQSYAVWYEF